MKINDFLDEDMDFTRNKATTTVPHTSFDLEDNIADWPGWVKSPKYGILGYSTPSKDNSLDSTVPQNWLRGLGYEIDTDGNFGPKTSAAMDDALNKIRNGEIKLTPSTDNTDSGISTSTKSAIDKAVKDVVTKSAIDKAVRSAVKEDGKIVPGVNTTIDVKPGQTEKEAKKFFGGNGKPKPLGVKGATPNQAFNLGLTEDINDKPHLYLDMDGVQADFFNAWAKWHEKTTGKPTATWRDIDDPTQSIKNMSSQGPAFIEKFFAELPVLPGFKLILNWLQKNNVKYTILSAPIGGQPDASIKGKKTWLAKHNPGAEKEIFTTNKAKYATTGGNANVLIDDHGKYIKNWEAQGGIAVKHTDRNPQRTIDALEKIYNPVNENISVTGTERGKSARKKKLRPGSEEWFKHWFSLPLMKRESFEQAKAELIEHIQKYRSNSTNSIMLEGYKLQLERDADMYVLHITDNDTGKRTEVRGKSGYESGNYDPNDKLHQLLDKIGKAANISDLVNGEVVGINPKHPDGASAKKHADTAFKEADIDYYNRKGTGQPTYMQKGNPGIGSMTDDEIAALAKPFLQKYNKSLEKLADDPFDPAVDWALDNDEVFQDIMTYYKGQLNQDPDWRRNLPSREYDTKYNVDDPREPRLQKPTAKDNPSAGYKFQRPPKEPV